MEYPLSCAASDASQRPTTQPTFTCFGALPKEIRDQIWEYAIPSPRLITLKPKMLKLTYAQWWRNKSRIQGDTKTDLDSAEKKESTVQDDSVDDLHTTKDRNTEWNTTGKEPSVGSNADIKPDTHDTDPKSDYEKTMYPEDSYKWHLENFGGGSRIFAPFCENRPSAMLLAYRESNQIAARHYTRTFSSRNWPGSSQPLTYFDYKRDILYLHPVTTVQRHRDLLRIPISYALNNIDIYDLQKVENLALNLKPRSDGREQWLWDDLRCTLPCNFPKLKNLYIVIDHCVSDRDKESDLFLAGLSNPVEMDSRVYLERYIPEPTTTSGLPKEFEFETKGVQGMANRKEWSSETWRRDGGWRW